MNKIYDFNEYNKCLRLLSFSPGCPELIFVDFEAVVTMFELHYHIDVDQLYEEFCECKTILAESSRIEGNYVKKSSCFPVFEIKRSLI